MGLVYLIPNTFPEGSLYIIAGGLILIVTPLSTLYNSLILKGLKFNSFLAKNCKPSIYRALEKRVESQVIVSILNSFKGMAYDWFNMLFAIVCIVIGSNKMLDLEIKFLPVMFIVIGVVALFANIKKLR